MTTLRPQIIRADTLDLQDSENPSAKDHTRQPAHPEPLGEGPAAPHQDAEMRHVAEERTAEEQYLAEAFNTGGFEQAPSHMFGMGTGPTNELIDTQPDSLPSGGLPQHSGMDNLESGDLDGDERQEEEAMDDKISSSPSIDDGGYYSFYSSETNQSSVGERSSVPVEALYRLSDVSRALERSKRSCPPMQNSPAPTQRHLRDKYRSAPPGSVVGCGSDDNIDWNHSQQRNLRHVRTHLDTNCRQKYSQKVGQIFSTIHEDERFGETVKLDDMTVEDYPEATPPSSTASSWVSSDGFDPKITCGEDDDLVDLFKSCDARLLGAGWGGECLRETEDIDFEFVYELHNFVATVEGQANATKGDTMVLLDDSNSYWWLVRIVKDTSIGYLPAEHIETPTERLARLNKHRNIDLSQTMLGDNTEKSKNPLKKAMRRRNAKIVSFTTPTYFEPLEIDWSDTDQDRQEQPLDDGQARRQGSQLDRSDIGSPEMGQLNGQMSGQHDGYSTDILMNAESRAGFANEQAWIDSTEGQDDATARLRPGPMRNTDSFYKDDSTGTKKISLTPDLLRDDSSRASLRSPEPDDRGASPDGFDMLGRQNPIPDKSQEDKKRKEKKSNMLSGLFRRKDKKIKVDEAAGNILARQDENGSTVFSPTTSGPGAPSGRASPLITASQGSLRNPRSNPNPLKSSLSNPSNSSSTNRSHEMLQMLQGRKSPVAVSESTRSESSNETRRDTGDMQPVTERTVHFTNINSGENDKMMGSITRLRSPEPDFESATKTSEPLLPDAKSATRPELNINTTLVPQEVLSVISPVSATDPSYTEFLHGRPEQVSPINGSGEMSSVSHVMQNDDDETTTATTAATSSDHDAGPIPVSMPSDAINGSFEATPKSSTEDSVLSTSAIPESVTTPDSSSPTATLTPATPTGESLPHLNPDSLLRFLEGNDIRDMLTRINDTTGVEPLAWDDPSMLAIGYHETQKRLDAISNELDIALLDYLTRNGIDF